MRAKPGWGRRTHDRLYRSPDPYSIGLSAYEQQKYGTVMDALAGRRFDRVLEVGCGEGDLSVRLAPIALWTRFAQGERGPALASIGGIDSPEAVESVRRMMKADPVFRAIPAVQQGRVAYLGPFETEFAAALGYSSPLSLPYAIDTVAPQLDAALQGRAPGS